MRSVRHSLASSTTARGRLPLYCSSLDSKRANKAKASAVEPANPASIFAVIEAPQLSRRGLQGLPGRA